MGAQTTISARVKNVTNTDQEVDVKLDIYEAGFSILMGPLIDSTDTSTLPKTAHLTIKAGDTGYATMTHVGTVGGPTNNGLASRHIIISTFAGGKLIGTPWTAKDVFGVVVGTATESYIISQPVVNGKAYPNQAKVLAGDTAQVQIKINNTSPQDENVTVSAEVHEHSLVGTGDLIGSPYTSGQVKVPSGGSYTFSFNHVADGSVDNTRDIVVTLYKGTELTPNTTPNNPNVFRYAFDVISKPANVVFQYGSLIVISPSGTSQEAQGTFVHFSAIVKNTGTAPATFYPTFRVREHSLINTGTWVSDEIADPVYTVDNPATLGPGDSLQFYFTWQVDGAVGWKDGALYLKRGTVQLGENDYSKIIEQIVPQTLTINISPSGAGTVDVERGDGSIDINVSTLTVRQNEQVTLHARGNFDVNSYWSGDTGL